MYICYNHQTILGTKKRSAKSAYTFSARRTPPEYMSCHVSQKLEENLNRLLQQVNLPKITIKGAPITAA